MLLLGGMKQENQNHGISQFTAAVYAFLRENIDSLDIEEISGSDFSSLLDLKKAIDMAVAKGMDKYRSGSMT